MPKRPTSSYYVDLVGDENLRPGKRINSSQPHSSYIHSSQGRSSQPRASQSFGNSQIHQPTSTQVERDAWRESNEEYDVVDLTQDVDEGFGWVCIGAIKEKV